MKLKQKGKIGLLKIIFSLLVGFINGFFGGGGGLVCVPALERVYKLPTKKAHATAIAIMFPLSVISSIIYIIKSGLSLNVVAPVGGGVIVGGLIGAMFLKKLNGTVIKWIFIAILFVSGFRMVV